MSYEPITAMYATRDGGSTAMPRGYCPSGIRCTSLQRVVVDHAQVVAAPVGHEHVPVVRRHRHVLRHHADLRDAVDCSDCNVDPVHVAGAEAVRPAAVVAAFGTEVRAVHRVVASRTRACARCRPLPRPAHPARSRDGPRYPNCARSTPSGIVFTSVPSWSYTVTVCVYIMFCANTRPVPVAITDLGEMSPVIVATCVGVKSRAGSWGAAATTAGVASGSGRLVFDDASRDAAAGTFRSESVIWRTTVTTATNATASAIPA